MRNDVAVSRAKALPVGMAVVASLLVAGVFASLLVGDLPIDGATAWESLVRHDPSLSSHVIVHDYRLPRAVADVLVGASLAVAGAIMQAVTRNPLASPGIMGLNTGASFATVVTMAFLPSLGHLDMIVVSIVGATLGATLVYGLGSISRGGLTPVRLALTGIAVSTLLSAIGNGVMIYHELGQDALVWFARGTEGVQWSDVLSFLPLALIGFAGALALAPAIGALMLGESVARGLGQRTALTKFLASAIVLALAGGAVALAGPVGFIGLMVPHMARRLVGMNYRVFFPASAVFGATLMLFADLGARLATVPFKTPVPVGAVTALIGVPFFLHLACRRTTRRAECSV